MEKQSEQSFSWFSVLKAVWFFVEDRKRFAVWNGVTFLAHFYDLIPPLIMGAIVDFFTSYHREESLSKFYWYAVILGITYSIVSIVRLSGKSILGDIGAKAMRTARVRGFERLMDFSLAWHSQENSGNKVQRIQTGAGAIKDWVQFQYNDLLRFVADVIGIIIVFIVVQPVLLLFFGVYFFVLVSIVLYFHERFHRLHMEFQEANESSSGTLFESASNMMSIKALGAKGHISSRVSDSEEKSHNLYMQLHRMGIVEWYWFQGLNGLALFVFLALIGHWVIGGSVGVGFILVFYSYFNRVKQASGDFMKMVNKIIEMKASIARLMQLFQDLTGIDHGKDKFPSSWNQIEIRNGSFSYEAENKSFEISDLNITIRCGEKIGVAGHSGGGKSTLAKLLLGMHRLKSGTFLIGKQNAQEVKHEEITAHISVVPQETELFNMSMRENIVLLKELPDGLFERALKIAQLESVIAKLPQGVETLIGEKGYRLSGGERQRVGIARAICRDPEVLILDEATSSLDSKTENSILEALESELRDKTLVIIAHRLSTLRNTDRIIVFEKGKIIEEGTFDSLLKNDKSHFAELYRIQKETMEN